MLSWVGKIGRAGKTVFHQSHGPQLIATDASAVASKMRPIAEEAAEVAVKAKSTHLQPTLVTNVWRDRAYATAAVTGAGVGAFASIKGIQRMDQFALGMVHATEEGLGNLGDGLGSAFHKVGDGLGSVVHSAGNGIGALSGAAEGVLPTAITIGTVLGVAVVAYQLYRVLPN